MVRVMRQPAAIAAPHRNRAGYAPIRQVLHQGNEEREIPDMDAPLKQGEHKPAAGGVKFVVGVFDTLGNGPETQHLAEIVYGQDAVKSGPVNRRVDGQ